MDECIGDWWRSLRENILFYFSLFVMGEVMGYVRGFTFALFAMLLLWILTRLFQLEVAYANLRGDLIVEVAGVVEGKVLSPNERVRLDGFYRDNLVLLSCGVPFYVSAYVEADMLNRLRQGAVVAWKSLPSVESAEFLCKGKVKEYLTHHADIAR